MAKMTKGDLVVQASMQHGGRLPIYYRVAVTHENQLKDWFEKLKNGKAMDDAFKAAFKMQDAGLFLSDSVSIYTDERVEEGAHFDRIKELLAQNEDKDEHIPSRWSEMTIIIANAMFNSWYGPKPTFMQGIGYWRFYSRFVWHLFRDETFREWCHDYISA